MKINHFLMFVILSGLMLSSSFYLVNADTQHNTAQTEDQCQTLVLDNFSTALNWIDESGGTVTRDAANEWLNWDARRTIPLHYYYPIDAQSGNIRLELRFRVTGNNGNGMIWLGLAEDLTVLPRAAAANRPGIFFAPDNNRKIQFISYNKDGTYQFIGATDTTLSYSSYNVWRKAVITIDQSNWKIEIFDDMGASLGYMNGSLVQQHASYKYVMLMFDYGSGWENMTGNIDDVKVVDCTQPISDKVTITHMEVIQATQTITNSVPLVAGKPTAVRVFIDCMEDCALIPNNTILRAFGSSGELTGSPITPRMTPFTTLSHEPDWINQRYDQYHSLEFLLPHGWLTNTVLLQVEIQLDNFTVASGLEVYFNEVKPLNIIVVPIKYNQKEPENGVWNEFVFPIQTLPITQINYVPGQTLVWDDCLDCPIIGTINKQRLLNTLTNQYHLTGVDDYYVYGILPEATLSGGMSDPAWWGGSGIAAIGDEYRGDKIFTHEISHLLGRRHTNTKGSLNDSNCWYDEGGIDKASDWDFDTSGIQELGAEWGVNGVPWLMLPEKNYDYMAYCAPEWTSPWTFTHIYSDTLRVNNLSIPSTLPTSFSPYIIASGLVFTDASVTLDPFWVISASPASKNPPIGTEYCLSGEDESGIPLVSQCFDLSFRNYETGEATEVDSFNLMLPYPNGVKRIVLKKDNQALIVRNVSSNSPIVTVLSPNGGENWNSTGSYTINWQAEDADGDSLTYSVLYSPDGVNWTPIVTGITETAINVDSSELAGGSQAKVRVLASDGVNTAYDESDNSFTVGGKAPGVNILIPNMDITIPPGQPFYLQGYAYDLEDGILERSDTQWSSSLDGNLGTGNILLVSLTQGLHTLTYSAVDKQGNSSQRTIIIYIGHKNYLPVISGP